MSEGMPLSDVLKSAPTATSLSGLSMLLADSSGNFAKMVAQSFAEALVRYMLNPSVLVTNIDEMTTSGIYKVASYSMQGTLPDIKHANYGHLFVLARDSTVQQIFISRTGICLRFKTIGTDWEDWKILAAA